MKHAHYTFQRGNRELAKELLSELLARHPNDEAAWMLLARIEKGKDRKIECYQRAIKINPHNTEAKIELTRLHSPSLAYETKQRLAAEGANRTWNGFKTFMRYGLGALALVLVLASTTFAIAKTNPQSVMARFLAPAPAVEVNYPLGDVAVKTRAEIKDKYPQYATFIDALIGLAVNSAQTGMEGAPARPGPQITVSQDVSDETRAILESGIPQPGHSSSVTLSQGQVTSWLAIEMQKNPDLPLKNLQVYFLGDQIQLWVMIENGGSSTSALVTGTIGAGQNGGVAIHIESLQIGQAQVPSLLLSQTETWLNQLLADAIETHAPGLRITQVIVSNGAITLTGSR